jgi:hypothetical protein
MNVVGHEAVGVDLEPELRLPFRQRVQIEEEVPGLGEHDTAVVPSLDNMMGGIGQDNPSGSWHRGSLLVAVIDSRDPAFSRVPGLENRSVPF